MKKKHFYSHLFSYEVVFSPLEKLSVTDEEKQHLQTLLEATLHHAVVDSLMDELSTSDKKIFMSNLISGEDDELWNFIAEKVESGEEKISKAIDKLARDISDDVTQMLREENQ